MKTTTKVAVKDFAPNDFFDWGGKTYKVIDTRPHPQDRDLTNVDTLDVDGDDNTFVLFSVAMFDVTRDDGLKGAPTHVVVDIEDGYVFSRYTSSDGFTLESATAFAAQRNAGSKRSTYRVFALSPVDQEN